MTQKEEESANGSVKLAGRDLVFRTSTIIQDHPAQSQEPHDVLPASLNHQTSRHMTLKTEMISGVFLGVMFIVITFNQGSNFVPNEGSLPMPNKLIDVIGLTSTTMDVLLESRIDDYWNVDGGWELSGALDQAHSVHNIEPRASKRVRVVQREI